MANTAPIKLQSVWTRSAELAVESSWCNNPAPMGLVEADVAAGAGQDWLALFHRGDRSVIEQVYRDQFGAVDAVVGRFLVGADRETVVHEVFFKLVSDQSFREKFDGRALGGWLRQVAKNQAIDFLRKRKREVPLADETQHALESTAETDREAYRSEAERLVGAFRKDHLPEKWAPVFEARFMKQLSQRDAAKQLGISRTTLAYREQRVRQLLKRFLLGGKLQWRSS